MDEAEVEREWEERLQKTKQRLQAIRSEMDKQHLLATIDLGPRPCQFGSWSLSWKVELLIAVVRYGDRVVDVARPEDGQWEPLLRKAVEQLEKAE